MNWKAEYKSLFWIVSFFLLTYFMPIQDAGFKEALFSAFELARWYAREHVLLCLVPAFLIAGVIAVFVSQAAVIKYFGAGTKKWLSYLVASVSGTVLAVCSCTILPLFSGIHKRGAGLRPALALLLAGPALSLPNMLVIRQVIGTQKTTVYASLVVFMATLSGLLYGSIF